MMSQRRYFYFYSSKLSLIVSKGDENSTELDVLGFYFQKLKLHEVNQLTA